MQARQWAQDVMLSMPTSLLKCSSNHIPSHERRSQAALAAWHRPSLHTPMRNMSASSCRAAATPDVENLTEPCIIVRPAVLSELDDVAWLRAEAFYEASCCQCQHSATHHHIRTILHHSIPRMASTRLQEDVMVSP